MSHQAPEVAALLNAQRELLEALRRLALLTERLLERAAAGRTLTLVEAGDARKS
jgi:hypothetical protein